MHASTIAALDTINVVAVADRADARAERPVVSHVCWRNHGRVRATGCQGCLLATPTPCLRRRLRHARRGLHVLCRNRCRDPAESLDIRRAAVRRLDPSSASGVATHHRGAAKRHSEADRSACRCIYGWRSGARIHRRFVLRSTGQRWSAVDCGVHEYDLAEWFTGRRVVRVRAYAAPIVDQSLTAVGDVDNLVAVLELEGGAIATVDLSRNCRFGDDVRTEILGSQGALLIDLLPTGRVRLGTSDGMVDLAGVDVEDVTAAGVANQAEAFAAAIRGTGPAGPGAIASARATLIGRAVQESIRTGEAIDIESIGVG